ncbi:MAG: hypothetical protein J5762_01630, partial [Clostridia bacterium]|nr:hypothetical protein [Clostridia bacterium]
MDGVTSIEVYGYATPSANANSSIAYMAWDEDSKTVKEVEGGCAEYTVVTTGTTTWEDGVWYVVEETVTITSRIDVSGTANLILCDGATLTAEKGIEVSSGNTLNVYAQSAGENMGAIVATADGGAAGIGGNYDAGGTITINGGIVTAFGSFGAAGIGGSYAAGGDVNIYGGVITANGGESGAGIGGGDSGNGGNVNIHGGTVTANGGEDASGIGGGYSGDGGNVNIYGGIITANGGEYGAGIGGGQNNTGGNVNIYGGTVTANGGKAASGIGGGEIGNGGDVNVYGGYVYATAGEGAVAIGAGSGSNAHGTLTVAEGYVVYGGTSADPTTVIEKSNNDYARSRYMIVTVPETEPVSYMAWDEGSKTVKEVEGGCADYTVVTTGTTTWKNGVWYVVEESVTISSRITVNGTVNLILSDGATLTAEEGIEVSSGNTLNVYAQSTGENMGAIVATGGENAAGIGSGYAGNGGDVNIHGGVITVNGGEYGAGIGGGDGDTGGGNGGNVKIYGGVITATGGFVAAGIGGGYFGNGGNVNIYGGVITANGGKYASGIGGGKGGNGGNVNIHGGVITANGGKGGTGIGAGDEGSSNGALTVAEGYVVYGGTSANPTTVIEKSDNDYARSRYMIVTVPEPEPVSYMAWDEDSKTVKEVEGGCAEYTVVTTGTTT